jgi:hypothetical protein
MLVPLLRRVFPRRPARRRRPVRPRLELLESRLVPALGRLPPVLVNPGNPAVGTDPGGENSYAPPGVAVAEDAAGDFVVVWTSTSQGSADILAQRFDPVGHPLGALITVAAGTFPATNVPRAGVGMDSAGDFVVTWDDNGGIFARRFDATGSAIDATPFQVDPGGGFDYTPAVALDDQGRFVIAYVSQGPSGYSILAQRGSDTASKPLSGGPLTVDFVPYSSFTYFQSPAVSADAAGDFAVVYEQVSYFSISGSSVFGQAFDPSGNPLGTTFVVSTSGAAASPSVALTRTSGEFAVTRVEQSGTPVLMAETYRINATDVTLLASPFAVSPVSQPPSSQPYDSPGVAADASGDFVAVWSVHAAPATGPGGMPAPPGTDPEPTGDVYAQTFSSDGTLTGSPLLITAKPDAPGPTGVAMDATGEFVVGFAASQQTVPTSGGPSATGNAYDIIAIIFRNLPPPPPPILPPVIAPNPVVITLPNGDQAESIALSQSMEQHPPNPVVVRPVVPPLPDTIPVVVLPALLPPALRRANPAATLIEQVGGTPAVGVISGRLFADLTGDGADDPRKPPLEGRLVYLDLNANGQLDEGEPVAVTDANGEYFFSSLPLQNFQVRQVLPGGDLQTLPRDNAAYEVRLDAARHDVAGRDFGNLALPRRAGPAGPAAPLPAPSGPTAAPTGGAEDDADE